LFGLQKLKCNAQDGAYKGGKHSIHATVRFVHYSITGN